jgi:hypothetical protein
MIGRPAAKLRQKRSGAPDRAGYQFFFWKSAMLAGVTSWNGI